MRGACTEMRARRAGDLFRGEVLAHGRARRLQHLPLGTGARAGGDDLRLQGRQLIPLPGAGVEGVAPVANDVPGVALPVAVEGLPRGPGRPARRRAPNRAPGGDRPSAAGHGRPGSRTRRRSGPRRRPIRARTGHPTGGAVEEAEGGDDRRPAQGDEGQEERCEGPPHACNPRARPAPWPVCWPVRSCQYTTDPLPGRDQARPARRDVTPCPRRHGGAAPASTA